MKEKSHIMVSILVHWQNITQESMLVYTFKLHVICSAIARIELGSKRIRSSFMNHTLYELRHYS